MTPDYLTLLGHKPHAGVPEQQERKEARDAAPARRRDMVEGMVRIKQHLRAHGRTNAKDLSVAARITYHAAYKYCRMMLSDGEVSVEKVKGVAFFYLNGG